MREFQVLPTDERYLNLTEEQLVWIVENFNLDVKEREKAAKGVDESYYDENYEEWEQKVLEEDEDLDAYFG